MLNYLTSQGYKVICALDGKDAIIKTGVEKPDTASIPIIAFSGSLVETVNEKEILGVDKFLGANFSAEDLASEVIACLENV